jgi:uncharacterized protein (DUF433 family)
MHNPIPGVYGGRPCGTRFPVLEEAVQLKAGKPAEEIAAEYELPLPHVYAGVAYCFLNRQAVAELSRR